ncbi:MAG TPA: PKD domain-containing protein [Thermoplasmatales archaeon]|nr:PKD domain-containing protein [Thermoplasmatales archaeon]
MGMRQIKIVCTILTLVVFILVLLSTPHAKAATLTVAGDYATIQQAIDNASNGDTISVSVGTYYERIFIVNKSISLIGESRDSTIIDASQNGYTIYVSNADGTLISGFTIKNAGGAGNHCLIMEDTSNATVTNNIIKNSQDADGLSLVRCHYITVSSNAIQDNSQGNGISALYSTHCTIQGNTLQRNQKGIILQYSSSDNTIEDNTIESNSLYGVQIWAASNNNIIYKNHFSDNGEENAYDTCTNYWYNAETHEGNYWDDYTGSDSNNDGIGDIPYNIPGGDNQDIYVLGFFEGGGSNPPQNNPPVANVGGQYSGYTNQLIYFDGSTSYDSDGNIVSYKWSFGDGSTEYGEKVSHKYAESGKYIVTLTVKDDDGATAIDSTTVNIIANPENQAPIANAGGPYYAGVGESIHFDASASYDSDGEIVSYLWNFGDGEKTFGETVYYSYDSEGTYIVTLTVTDNNGSVKTAYTTAIISSGSGTKLSVDLPSSYTGFVGQNIQFTATTSGNNIVSYTWDFGDGTELITQNSTINHTYSEAGIYNVTITVSDTYGKNATDVTTVIITDPWKKEETPGFEMLFAIFSIVLISFIRRRYR